MSFIPSSPTGALLPAFEGQLDSPPCSSPVKTSRQPQNAPSSPVIEDEYPAIDKMPRLATFYPTPVPSSVANLSSPPPSKPSEDETFASVEAQEKRFTLRSPLSTVALVRLPVNGTSIRIGRSSKSCQVALNSKNKLVSRVHVQTSYDAENNQVVIDCLGWNGIAVYVPSYEAAAQIASEMIHKNGYPTANGQQEHEVFKDETIFIEYVPGIVIDVRGERALIELVEDINDETEDERAGLYNASSPVVPVSSPAAIGSSPVWFSPRSASQPSPVPAVRLLDFGKETNVEVGEVGEVGEGEDVMTPKNQSSILGQDDTRSPLEELNPNEYAPVIYNTVASDAEEKEMKKKIMEGSKELNMTPEELNKLKVSKRSNELKKMTEDENKKKKRQSCEPDEVAGGKRSKKASTPDIIPEEQYEEGVPLSEGELADLKHIISNHLAFSRLKSTPLSTIRKSNSKLEPLTVPQLREILMNTRCIGVISRSGKDAAGKKLEDEYYYDPEHDTDLDRIAMVEQTRGRTGLRQCRKTHKQYFWKKPKK
ncbi:protein Tos4p [Trichomonascus vanleenenianus]|uniref:FHA domain-containing protein n=1 Tax=Trichomonascus vanleenenianus TaxID=2268995 RepID=UPI003EC99D4F